MVLWTLAGTVALLLIALPVTAADVLLPLPNVAIPPAQGKTLSADIIEVDQAAHLMYVADRVTRGVDVFDISTASAKYLLTIPAGTGTNGVSVAKNVNKLFIATNTSDVLIVDINPASPKRNTVIAKLNTGGKKRTDEMDYDPQDMKLYVANSDDGIIASIDAVTNTIIKKWTDQGEGLEQPRYNPSDGQMYMTSSDQNVVFEFDPRKDVLVKKWDVGAACNPNGLAINPKTNQALLGCSNKKTPMTVLWDLKTKKVVTTFTQAGAGDMTVYNAKDNLFFFAASNFPRGAVLAVFTGGPNVRFIGGAPTAVGSHAVGYDQTNRVVYTLDQRPNSAGLMAFWLAGVPK